MDHPCTFTDTSDNKMLCVKEELTFPRPLSTKTACLHLKQHLKIPGKIYFNIHCH